MQKPKKILTQKLPEYSSFTLTAKSETNNRPKFIQFFRDLQVIIFYDTFYDIYSVETNLIQRKSHTLYLTVKDHNLKLFQVPKIIENKVNIFFS